MGWGLRAGLWVAAVGGWVAVLGDHIEIELSAQIVCTVTPSVIIIWAELG